MKTLYKGTAVLLIAIVAAITFGYAISGNSATQHGWRPVAGGGPSTWQFAGVPAGNASGIENIYIVKHTENYLVDFGGANTAIFTTTDNGLGVITATAGSATITYGTTFDIVVAVKGGSDNCYQIVKDNIKVELVASGAFTINDNAGTNANKYLFGSSDNSWGTWNMVFDNGGAGYTLSPSATLSMTTVRLWCWK